MASDPNVLILDGAAGTYLESQGVDLHPKLWSSGTLLTSEGHDMIRKLHQAYIASNVDVITSVTYQASVPGLMAAGVNETESHELITRAVCIAREEAEKHNAGQTGHKVRVAAGLGPYGAYLSQGEEYTGDYGSRLTQSEFDSFWIPRVKAALKGNPDFLLFETVPNYDELKAIVTDAAPLARAAGVPVWISFSLKVTDNSVTLADGTPIDTIKQLLSNNRDLVQLIGANCFDVALVPRVIDALNLVGLPLIIYPNSGETYDGHLKTWTDNHADGSHGTWDPKAWATRGVRVIGGCCRTTPETISEISSAVQL